MTDSGDTGDKQPEEFPEVTEGTEPDATDQAHENQLPVDPDALGLFGLVEIVLFIGTVAFAYAYVWRRGGLDWS